MPPSKPQPYAESLAAIPIRINVAGTVGKTSVASLIGGILRERGIATVARLSGERSVLVLPDGTEEPLPAAPNDVLRTLRVLIRAADVSARGIVNECPGNGLRPDERLIRPTLTVITTASCPDGTVASPEGTVNGFHVPRGGALVTADRNVALILGPGVLAEGGTISLSSPSLDPFVDSPEEAANLGLARRVAEILGIPRSIAARSLSNGRRRDAVTLG